LALNFLAPFLVATLLNNDCHCPQKFTYIRPWPTAF